MLLFIIGVVFVMELSQTNFGIKSFSKIEKNMGFIKFSLITLSDLTIKLELQF